MKKTLSTQSLLGSRRSSILKIQADSHSHLATHKFISKPKDSKESSSIIKNTLPQKKYDDSKKPELNKNDIKQIYEYKIKEKAKQSKLMTQKSQQFSKAQLIQPQNQTSQNQRYTEALKLENQKMSKQLYDTIKQNKRLKQLLISSQNLKNNAKNTIEAVNHQKDYKKQMFSKLNERQRLKTQMTASFSKAQFTQSKPERKDKGSKDKKSGSKNMRRDNSKNSITMNLNMSFVKMKSPSSGKNSQFVKNHSKQMMDRMMRSSSTKHLFKESQMVQPKQEKPPASIKSLFKELSTKKQVNLKDLEEFYSLNKKIFSEFNDMISFSKQTFTDLLNKTNISECYDSKKMQESKHSMGQNTKMKIVLDKIQELYRANSFGNGNQNFKEDQKNENSSGKKYNVSEIEPNELLTPESSVMSFTELQNNPEREKSHQRYRVKKLNENLGLLANFQNKKLRTEATQACTTEPKVFFSKPVSTHVSRKISFNNSYNNSLKNSKIE